MNEHFGENEAIGEPVVLAAEDRANPDPTIQPEQTPEASGQNEPNERGFSSAASEEETETCDLSDPQPQEAKEPNEPTAQPSSPPQSQCRRRRHLTPFQYKMRHFEKRLDALKTNAKILNQIEECYGHRGEDDPPLSS